MESSSWIHDIKVNMSLSAAVVEALPKGTRVLAVTSCGVPAWTKTAKISANLPDETIKRYFLKCITGQGAKALVEGEYESAKAINEFVPGLVPKPAAWGDYHDMDLSITPEPSQLMAKIAELHQKGTSPNGKFGFPVPTVCGKMERTVVWEDSWAKSFTHQLKDVIQYDNDTNGAWPEFEMACNQLINNVIPRLLGVLQSDGRQIKPSLIHGDLWEQNIGIDMETGETVVFDPGCTYAHNEMEFGTWRCTWAFYFNFPVYTSQYQQHIRPSVPVEEWDDRNRLYSLHPYLNDSAGHPGSFSRQIAYSDMLFLIEKYDPKKDIAITRAYVPFEIKQLE